MNRMNKMKKLRLISSCAMLLCFVSIFSIGFASWFTFSPVEGRAEGSFQAYGVESWQCVQNIVISDDIEYTYGGFVAGKNTLTVSYVFDLDTYRTLYGNGDDFTATLTLKYEGSNNLLAGGTATSADGTLTRISDDENRLVYQVDASGITAKATLTINVTYTITAANGLGVVDFWNNYGMDLYSGKGFVATAAVDG